MKNWIICTGPDWYRPSVTSTRQIILKFKNDDYNILWVNPVAFKSPAVNSDSKKSMKKKITNKLLTHLKIYKKVENGLYVFVPLYIPIFNNKWEKINNKLIYYQLIGISRILNIKWSKTILWISGNFTLSPLLKYSFRNKIYQAADLISEFRTEDTYLLANLRKKETYLSKNVDYIFASSPNIKKKLEILSGRSVHLLTHGVDYNHFANKKPLNPQVEKIRNTGLPVAGYYGTLSDANDKQVFSILADNGFSVIIIGKVLGDYSMLEDKRNVHFLGPIDFKDLPSYAQGFDVCLLNWIMADWIKNSFPVKSLEYLAMGKPIISCKIPILQEMFGSLLYFAETPQEFLLQARKGLEDNNESIAKLRMEAASNNTWDNKYSFINSVIHEHKN